MLGIILCKLVPKLCTQQYKVKQSRKAKSVSIINISYLGHFEGNYEMILLFLQYSTDTRHLA